MNSLLETKEAFVYLAKVANEIDEDKDTIDFMKKASMLDDLLTEEEIAFLTKAYKSIIAKKLYSLRRFYSLKLKEELNNNRNLINLLQNTIDRTIIEVIQLCDDILSILEAQFLKPYVKKLFNQQLLKLRIIDVFIEQAIKEQICLYQGQGIFFSIKGKEKQNYEALEISLAAYKKAYDLSTCFLPSYSIRHLLIVVELASLYQDSLDNPTLALYLIKKSLSENMNYLEKPEIVEEDLKSLQYMLEILNDLKKCYEEIWEENDQN